LLSGYQTVSILYATTVAFSMFLLLHSLIRAYSVFKIGSISKCFLNPDVQLVHTFRKTIFDFYNAVAHSFTCADKLALFLLSLKHEWMRIAFVDFPQVFLAAFVLISSSDWIYKRCAIFTEVEYDDDGYFNSDARKNCENVDECQTCVAENFSIASLDTIFLLLSVVCVHVFLFLLWCF